MIYERIKGCYLSSDIPGLTYTSIKINNVETLGTSIIPRVSFVNGYNNISVTFTTPTNQSLKKFQIRITLETGEFGIDKGTQPILMTNLAANTSYTATFGASATYFTSGSNTYRVSLYAQGSSGVWDCVYLLFTTDNNSFHTSDSNDFNVLTDTNIN